MKVTSRVCNFYLQISADYLVGLKDRKIFFEGKIPIYFGHSCHPWRKMRLPSVSNKSLLKGRRPPYIPNLCPFLPFISTRLNFLNLLLFFCIHWLTSDPSIFLARILRGSNNTFVQFDLPPLQIQNICEWTRSSRIWSVSRPSYTVSESESLTVTQLDRG